jgi:hypothetical protein
MIPSLPMRQWLSIQKRSIPLDRPVSDGFAIGRTKFVSILRTDPFPFPLFEMNRQNQGPSKMESPGLRIGRPNSR